jgi:hypothetical protein
MDYFTINGVDYSKLVNALNVSTEAKYNAQQNAAGDTVIDYINAKKAVEVGFIPMSDADCAALFSSMTDIVAPISFLDPKSGQLMSAVCLCPSDSMEYYTIQSGKVMLKAFSLTFTEL